MMLLMLILLPVAGAIIALLSQRYHCNSPRYVALLTLLATAIPVVSVLLQHGDSDSRWLAQFDSAWLPDLNIRLFFALDGLSLVMVTLTILISLVALASAWHEITSRSGLFYCNLLLTIAGIIGVFIALDLLMFFVFWEVMLVPMFFLINIWGHQNRHYAALKFLIFTQFGGLLMLISICALALLHQQATGQFSFNYLQLQQLHLSPTSQFWLGLGFMLAFLVKLPAVPIHSWLPDAHTEAPTAASIILAAILLKTSGYGLIRFVLVLFPDFTLQFAPLINTLAVVGIIYGALLAFAQTDLKRLVAYSSISHMGFVLLGCFSLSHIALQGAVVQMIAHGLTSAGLFAIAGMIQRRYHTRDLAQLGGLAQQVPKLSGMAMVLVMATLGMPGLGNFIGEFLVLVGSFESFKVASIVAATGLIFSACYALVIIHRTFWGPVYLSRQTNSQASSPARNVADVNRLEQLTLLCLIVLLLLLGLHPQPVLDLIQQVSAITITLARVGL